MKVKITIQPVRYENEQLILLDQRKIPFKEEYLTLNHLTEIAEAIKSMIVRGAPAIGVTGAYGYVIGIREGLPESRVYEELLNTRPTAVNLRNALEEMRKTYEKFRQFPDKVISALEKQAHKIFMSEREKELKMGEIGASLLPADSVVITHCNTGALATTGWGTALGVIRSAHYSGKKIFVWVDETRPRLQGARLTAWELVKEGIPHKLIADNSASYVMKNFKIDAIFVGADRIALNGDTANKIGTYQLAISAKFHGVPFYIVAPTSTIDPMAKSGRDIPIEERDESEVKQIDSCSIAPEETPAFNPAFDVTPAELITGGIITEKGLSKFPFRELEE